MIASRPRQRAIERQPRRDAAPLDHARRAVVLLGISNRGIIDTKQMDLQRRPAAREHCIGRAGTGIVEKHPVQLVGEHAAMAK